MNPYFHIWFKTGKTLDSILFEKASFLYHIPLVLTGLTLSIGFNNLELGPIGFIVSLALSTCVFYFFLGHIFPWGLSKTGRIWNGEASFQQLQLVVSLSQIPTILILIIQIVWLTQGEFVRQNEINSGISLIAWIFSIRILILGIAKAQRFNYGISIVSMFLVLLPFIIIQFLRM